MQAITLLQPKRISFGPGCAELCADDAIASGSSRVLVVCDPRLVGPTPRLVEPLWKRGMLVSVYDEIDREPTIEMFARVLATAQAGQADGFVGIGGGSVLDVTKLLAALVDGRQDVRDTFGIGKLGPRKAYLACLPTTAGTGSEVSPNAILTDESDKLKKGVVSPHLVPDAAFVDPTLTLTLPPAATASTGMDAMTHCIEAYANRHAHPAVDLYALEGIRLIGANLEQAVAQGQDVRARGCLALGSLYGGLCLGPVNTAAVHALAYPLGGEFGVAHGVANSLLLPHVLEFNLPAAPRRYAEVALALGAAGGGSAEETARWGLERIREISHRCGIPPSLSQLGVPREAIDRMATSAMQVTRLLKNNLRELGAADAAAIYQRAF